MRKLYFFILLAFVPFAANSQCSVTANVANVTCFGSCDGYATAVPQGAGPYSYLWQPGNMTTQTVTGLCAGSYSLIMIDSGNACTATYTFAIYAPPQLQAIVSMSPASCQSCCDGSGVGTATGGVSPYTYMWSPVMVFTPSVTNLCVGTYTFCVTDANGCTTCTTSVVNFTTGIQEQNNPAGLSIQPNPAQTTIQLSAENMPAGDYTLSVYDPAGKLIETRSGNHSAVFREDLDVSAYASGLYLIRLQTGNTVSVQRFLRE